MSLPLHGEVRYIGEVLDEAADAPAACRSVRTFGSLRAGGAEPELPGGFALEHDGRRLPLDVALLGEAVSLKTGSMYMVVGEVQALAHGKSMQARVVRNVDGMDVELFSAALKLHRDFEQQRQAA
eukprot:Tamp_11297.p3 GENE.Tamp_11297~~Tamp_11297.p3  ORF type:complete len:134 (-),score=42.75 Tamp_11297:1533-1907(-)